MFKSCAKAAALQMGTSIRQCCFPIYTHTRPVWWLLHSGGAGLAHHATPETPEQLAGEPPSPHDPQAQAHSPGDTATNSPHRKPSCGAFHLCWEPHKGLVLVHCHTRRGKPKETLLAAQNCFSRSLFHTVLD